MSKTISINEIASSINEILEDTKHQIIEATNDALDEAADVMKNCLEEASPRGKTKKLAESWKIKKQGRSRRIINGKKVKGASGSIPLVNILEYSTKHGNPFVDRTLKANESKVVSIFKKNIKVK